MYIPTIGLEIHTEVKTKTKMFCSCLNPVRDIISNGINNPEETKPNVNVCPVCLAHPGSLPVINKMAIIAIAKLGLALDGKIDNYSQFDRKSYFYPDLPKGYQISQYEHPIVKGGMLKGIRLTRIHMEEDTGRLLHLTNNQQLKTENYSLVDFNRAGVPLIELVTEPDVKNAEQAVAFAKELQLILRYLGISDADMEKGQMRVEANISLMPTNTNTNNTNKIRESRVLGTKVEVKNINSFKAVHDAIEYEIKRQAEILNSGGKIIQETRGWNDVKNITQSQRSKESAHDYRYFPEPDLPPLNMSAFNLKKLKDGLPELPEAKRKRFINEYKIPENKVETLISEKAKAEFFENSISELKSEMATANCDLLTNYFTSDLQGLMSERKTDIQNLKISSHEFAHFISLIETEKLSSKLAKELLRKMFETGDDPESLIKQGNLSVIQDESVLIEIVKKIIILHPQAIKDYELGKSNALQFLVGKAMAETKGKANPQILNKLFKEVLD